MSIERGSRGANLEHLKLEGGVYYIPRGFAHTIPHFWPMFLQQLLSDITTDLATSKG